MTSLRARIILLLILAIVSVVGLATFAAIRAMRPPEMDFGLMPMARQLHLVVSMAEHDRAAAIAAGIDVQPGPARGETDVGTTNFLKEALEKTGDGNARSIIVTTRSSGSSLTASLKMSDGQWLIAEIPDIRPPPGGLMILAGWIAAIILGSTAISIYAAGKIIRPLEFLEQSVSLVGPDGLLPVIPESGPGEVRATARALNRLSARLKTAIESRMRLVAAAGHDLRTPMTRMRLRAEFIADDEERTKWLNDLEELDAIADSAIRLVKEEVNATPDHAADLGALVDDIASELADQSYEVAMPVLTPMQVQAAPVALKRALRNLIINAATHGGGATIDLESVGGHAVLTIRDRGPGIPEDLIGQVFEPFFRVDMARRKTVPGAGLGLAIAKEIIERSGGAIRIANRAGGGLVQTVTLPCATSHPSSPESA